MIGQEDGAIEVVIIGKGIAVLSLDRREVNWVYDA